MTLAFANERTATDCGKSVCEALAGFFRNLFPRKTALHFAALSGLQVRAAEYFLSRKTSLSGEAYIRLLRTDHGFEVLRAMMGDAEPQWWIRHKTVDAVATATAKLSENRKVLDRAMGAEDELTKAMARAAAALSISDTDFAGSFADGVRSMVSPPGRPVAATASRSKR